MAHIGNCSSYIQEQGNCLPPSNTVYPPSQSISLHGPRTTSLCPNTQAVIGLDKNMGRFPSDSQFLHQERPNLDNNTYRDITHNSPYPHLRGVLHSPRPILPKPP